MKSIAIQSNRSPKRLARLKHALSQMMGSKWEVRRTIWPYRDGWGVYNPAIRTIANHGLSYAQACQECAELNEGLR